MGEGTRFLKRVIWLLITLSYQLFPALQGVSFHFLRPCVKAGENLTKRCNTPRDPGGKVPGSTTTHMLYGDCCVQPGTGFINLCKNK